MQNIIVIGIILALFIFAIRHTIKSRGSCPSCSSCHSSNCCSSSKDDSDKQ